MMSDIYIILKAAITVDGFLGAEQRLVISSAEDRQEVLKLRDSVDAILIGAETLRLDNPSLLGNTKNPLRVVLSSKGEFQNNLNLFNDNKSKTRVYHSNSHDFIREGFFYLSKDNFIGQVLEDLKKIGVKRLLVEGGADILSQFYNDCYFSELRLSIGAQLWGNEGKRLVLSKYKNLQLSSVSNLGDSVVHLYHLK